MDKEMAKHLAQLNDVHNEEMMANQKTIAVNAQKGLEAIERLLKAKSGTDQAKKQK